MSPEIVKKISSPGPVFLIIPFIIVVIFMLTYQQSNDENNKIDCLTHKVTIEELRSLSTGKGTTITQQDVDKINQKPLCKDICLEQIKYSNAFPNWRANSDMRNTCKEIGLPLLIK
jgi:hypothetical protein